MTTGTTTWARWRWSKGLGRWHRLFTDGDLTRTACDTPRKSSAHVAEQTAAKPTGSHVCPICKSLDELLDKVMSGSLTDAVAGVDETITIPAATDKPLAPVGICTCGCDQSDEARAYKAALATWEAAERVRHEAEFAAFLADKAVAS